MLYNQEDLSSNPQYEHKNLNVSEYAEIYNIYISCVCACACVYLCHVTCMVRRHLVGVSCLFQHVRLRD